MIDLKRPRLSVVRQCALLQLNRSGVYYRPVPESETSLALMRLIDVQFLETPYYGSRQMTRHLRLLGKVLSWRLSNTMDAGFCIGALQEAPIRYGAPDICNTEQGSQFTTPRFTEVLAKRQIRISMDGRGGWLDNVFIERLWRSLKYERIYLHAFETGSELRIGLAGSIASYNGKRPHPALAGRTPAEAYHDMPTPMGPELAPDPLANSNAVKRAA